MTQPDTLFARLATEKADVILVGGLAATLHGVNYVTFDVDFCYDPTDDNRERLVRALAPLRPYPRGIERGLPFVWDARTLRDTPLLTLTTTSGDVDLMSTIPGVGAYGDVRVLSDRFEIGGTPVVVLSVEGLLRAKRAMNRPKDQIVLMELEALADASSRPASSDDVRRQ